MYTPNFRASIAVAIALSPLCAFAAEETDRKTTPDQTECGAPTKSSNELVQSELLADPQDPFESEINDFEILNLSALESQSFARAASSGGC